MKVFTDNEIVYPVPKSGHYIHGPQTVVHLIYFETDSLVGDIVNKELDKLCDRFIA